MTHLSNHHYRPKVLHIDDEQMIRLTLGDYLRDNGYDVLEAASGHEGLSIFREARPDVVITDLAMPDSSGQHVLETLQRTAPDTPVIIFSGTGGLEEALTLIRKGARDFIAKPVREMDQIRDAIETAMNKASLLREMRQARTNLEMEVSRQTRELRTLNDLLEHALRSIVSALGVIVENKDPYTAGHNDRVACIAMALGKRMGLSSEKIETLRLAGNLHDIGKVGVPEEILNKPHRLTPKEFEQVKLHPGFGFEILKDIPFQGPVADTVLQHHERYDGTGYPRGLHGEETLLEARILAVADVYEALTSDRPYRRALRHKVAMEFIRQNASSLLCPKCAESFLKISDQCIKEELNKKKNTFREGSKTS